MSQMNSERLLCYLRQPLRFQKKTVQLMLKQLECRRITFSSKKEMERYTKRLLWFETFPWRTEQEKIMSEFYNWKQDSEQQELLIQAVFGSGKTTMMMAMIYSLLIHRWTRQSHIMVCAFNVAIKNEIKRHLQAFPHIHVRTFDSMVYQCVEELGYDEHALRSTNYQGKRRFLKDNLHRLKQCHDMEYIFVDESQDLERDTYHVFCHRFPNAKKIWIGDIFQSIQKEPKESLHYHLLKCTEDKKRKVFWMKQTPRVPAPILENIQEALVQHYPQFAKIISGWETSNMLGDIQNENIHTRVQPQQMIQWHSFSKYSDIFQKLEHFLSTYPHDKCMILTFSSTITVRGCLGDVARIRRFLVSKKIAYNHSHKKMNNECVFLSTANSSKGLERDHVFVMLSFPLEKAFVNFSRDLVVNLVTVAVSRAKKSIDFYVPSYMDRYSHVLYLYSKCPRPNLISNYIPKKCPEIRCTELDMSVVLASSDAWWKSKDILQVLMTPHSVTECLRQSIFPYETRAYLLKGAKGKTEFGPMSKVKYPFSNDDEWTYVGIFIEAMILMTWTGRWMSCSCTYECTTHNIYHSFSSNVTHARTKYHQATRKPVSSCSSQERFKAQILFSTLHLTTHQNICFSPTSTHCQILWQMWKRLEPFVTQTCLVGDHDVLKTQMNLGQMWLKGIADAVITTKTNEFNEIHILELKASRSGEWRILALLQSICYGILLGKNKFQVSLWNGLNPTWWKYQVQFQQPFHVLKDILFLDLLIWNMNCLLCQMTPFLFEKQPSISLSTKQPLFFIIGEWDLEGNIVSFHAMEMMTPTKLRTHLYWTTAMTYNIYQDVDVKGKKNVYQSFFEQFADIPYEEITFVMSLKMYAFLQSEWKSHFRHVECILSIKDFSTEDDKIPWTWIPLQNMFQVLEILKNYHIVY